MQVLLNTDPNVDGRQQMSDHLEVVVKDALGRFGEQITRVEAHLSDANSQSKPSPDDIHCTLEARLRGRDPVVVKDHAGTAHQAINGAVGKLKRALATTLEKNDPRRGEGLSEVVPVEPPADETGERGA
jgi:ribosome-associated translation inhibitor RaiA